MIYNPLNPQYLPSRQKPVKEFVWKPSRADAERAYVEPAPSYVTRTIYGTQYKGLYHLSGLDISNRDLLGFISNNDYLLSLDNIKRALATYLEARKDMETCFSLEREAYTRCVIDHVFPTWGTYSVDDTGNPFESIIKVSIDGVMWFAVYDHESGDLWVQAIQEKVGA